MVELHLEQGYSIATMLAVIAVAILLAAVFYYRTFGMLRRGQWQLLLALRIVAIVVVALLLFRPMITYHKDLQQRPALVQLLRRGAHLRGSRGVVGRHHRRIGFVHLGAKALRGVQLLQQRSLDRIGAGAELVTLLRLRDGALNRPPA